MLYCKSTNKFLKKQILPYNFRAIDIFSLFFLYFTYLFLKKKMSNSNLKNAKKKKNDEFYTQLSDIEKEMVHYKEHLKGKWIYSPCDDYRWSNFKVYFKEHFEELGLKHYTCTCYDIGDGAWRYDYDGVNETITQLEGDGDFRSEECVRIKNECDVIITNPPFSLFREFIKWMDL